MTPSLKFMNVPRIMGDKRAKISELFIVQYIFLSVTLFSRRQAHECKDIHNYRITLEHMSEIVLQVPDDALLVQQGRNKPMF